MLLKEHVDLLSKNHYNNSLSLSLSLLSHSLSLSLSRQHFLM